MKHFGEPIHKSNLPSFPLEEGKVYLVPLVLVSKERRFDGGRGTEFYRFCPNKYDHCRFLSFADYDLPKLYRIPDNMEKYMNNSKAFVKRYKKSLDV